jgi:hypothetical protein
MHFEHLEERVSVPAGCKAFGVTSEGVLGKYWRTLVKILFLPRQLMKSAPSQDVCRTGDFYSETNFLRFAFHDVDLLFNIVHSRVAAIALQSAWRDSLPA